MLNVHALYWHKVSLNLISPTARVAHKEVVDGALVPQSYAYVHDLSPEVWKSNGDTIKKSSVAFVSYQVYQDIWEAAVDEELVCRPKRSNPHNRYCGCRIVVTSS